MYAVKDLSGVLRGRIDQCSDPSHPSTTDDGGKLTDLEQILEQKTFTRQVAIYIIQFWSSQVVIYLVLLQPSSIDERE